MFFHDQVNILISKIYECAIDASRWETTLSEMRSLFNAVGILVFYRDINTGDLVGHLEDCIPEKGLREYGDHYLSIDPRVRYVSQIPARSVAHDLLFIDENQMRRHEYYDWLKQFDGMQSFLGSKLFADENIEAFFSIQFAAPPQDAAAPANIALLNTLLPHLERAIRLNRAFNLQKISIDALAALSETKKQGVIVVGARNGIRFANGAARAMLAECDGLSCRRGQVVAASPQENNRLRTLIREAVTIRPDENLRFNSTISISRPSFRRSFCVVVSRLDQCEDIPGLEEPAALIVVTDPERSATVSPKKAAALHGLTHSEAQLAAALASGHSIREYAATAEISEHTARWHLKQVFSKTGTKRQTQLVRLLLTELAP